MQTSMPDYKKIVYGNSRTSITDCDVRRMREDSAALEFLFSRDI